MRRSQIPQLQTDGRKSKVEVTLKVRLVYLLLFALHLLVGIGAVFGGLAAILDPHEPLGIPADSLVNSPFTSFLIPGIILFTIIGLGNIISALTLRFDSKYQGYISFVFGLALVIFIVVQCIMLNSIVFLHVIFFMIGIVKTVLSVLVIWKQHLFPFHK